MPLPEKKPDPNLVFEARRELDNLVVNIELTLTSIIQGVALYFLTENAREPLSNGQFEYWIYVANGLVIIFLFWSRSVSHTLTVIRWPIEFSHNFLYIACSLFEALAFTRVKDPLLWFGFNTAFAVAVWILFVVDRQMIRSHQRKILSAAETELYLMIGKDQDRNIYFLIPIFVGFFLATTIAISIWPTQFLQGRLHVVTGCAQFIGLIFYLVYVIVFFQHLSPPILKSRADRTALLEARK